jgi:S1-C subfamily serine protease
MVAILFAYVPLLQDKYYYEYKGSSIVKVLRVDNQNSGGTGFQIQAPSGLKYIMTNNHVCEIKDKFNQVIVESTEGIRHKLLVLHQYAEHDLCLLEPFPDMRPLRIAKNIYMAERVYLIGHPRLAPLTFERGYYRGNMLINIGFEFYSTFSFNLISYGGNSGSPIIDVYGNVVSVLFAGMRGAANFTYGVPLNHIHKFLRDK